MPCCNDNVTRCPKKDECSPWVVGNGLNYRKNDYQTFLPVCHSQINFRNDGFNFTITSEKPCGTFRYYFSETKTTDVFHSSQAGPFINSMVSFIQAYKTIYIKNPVLINPKEISIRLGSDGAVPIYYFGINAVNPCVGRKKTCSSFTYYNKDRYDPWSYDPDAPDRTPLNSFSRPMWYYPNNEYYDALLYPDFQYDIGGIGTSNNRVYPRRFNNNPNVLIYAKRNTVFKFPCTKKFTYQTDGIDFVSSVQDATYRITTGDNTSTYSQETLDYFRKGYPDIELLDRPDVYIIKEGYYTFYIAVGFIPYYLYSYNAGTNATIQFIYPNLVEGDISIKLLNNADNICKFTDEYDMVLERSPNPSVTNICGKGKFYL